MNMQDRTTTSIVEAHLKNFFVGRNLAFERWETGVPKTLQRRSGLRIAKIPPRSDEDDWAYISVGAWESSRSKAQSLEFLIFAPYETSRITELLTMAVNHQRTEHLEFEDVFPIGEGWLPGSECDHFLVSLPYPLGPDFAVCHVANDFHVRFAWLVPITRAEKDFAITHSVEQLETKFRAAAIEYSNPERASVV